MGQAKCGKAHALPGSPGGSRSRNPPAPPCDVGEYWGGRGEIFGLAPAIGGSNWYASFRSELGPDKVEVAEALEVTRERYANYSSAVRGCTLTGKSGDVTGATHLDHSTHGSIHARERCAGRGMPRTP